MSITFLINLLIPEGAVGGERPLEFELDVTFSFRNSNLFTGQYPICFGQLKDLPKRENLIKLNPDKANPFMRKKRKAVGLLEEI
jgi:hypothetical protein